MENKESSREKMCSGTLKITEKCAVVIENTAKNQTKHKQNQRIIAIVIPP